MKMWTRSFIVLIVFTFLVSCAQVASVDSKSSDAADNKSSYIESLVKSAGRNTISLNLADNKQYEYIRNSYLEAGQTAENAPELFEGLENARKAALESNNVSRVDDTEVVYYADRDFMVSSVFTYAGRFYVTVTSTVKDGSKASYIRLRIRDKDGKILTSGPSGWIMTQEFTNGKCLVLKVNLPLPTNGVSVITLEGLETLNVNGVLEYKSTITKAIVGDDDPGMMEKIVVEHPADKNKDGQVFIGLDRLLLAKDDYLPMSDFGRKIKVPFKGYFRVPYKVNAAQVNRANTFIKLLGPSQGGTTAMKYKGLDGSTFADTLVFTEGPNGSTFIEWDISRADCWFDNPALFNRLEKVNWYINISFDDAEIFPGWVEPQMTYCASNDIDTSNLLPGLYPPHLVFHWSCIAAGSIVKMADGSYRPVEKIQIGDVVKGNGANLTVVDLSIGKEFKPMYRIVDEASHNLLITERHPVLTENRGIIWPSELNTGDVIVTENGTKKVAYIGKEYYQGTVHSLQLGTPEELAVSAVNANMFYANGILIADTEMQSKYEFKDQQ